MKNRLVVIAAAVWLSANSAWGATVWSSQGSPYSYGQPGYVGALAQTGPVGTPWLDPTAVMTVAYDRQLAYRWSGSWMSYSPGPYLSEPAFARVGTTGSCVTQAFVVDDQTTSVALSGPNGFGGCTSSTVNIGGNTAFPPAVSAFYSTSFVRIDVFINEDGVLKVRTFTGSTMASGTWGSWVSLNGVIRGGPAAVSPAFGRVDVVARGTDNAFYWKTFSGGSWTANWTPLGGNFTSDPSITSQATNKLELVGRTTDYSILRRSFNGSTWDLSYRSCNGSASSRPSIVFDSTNAVIRMYIRGFDWAIWSASGDCL